MNNIVATRFLVDGLFAELEKKFAGRPLILLAIAALHAAAIDLVPLLAKNAETRQQGKP